MIDPLRPYWPTNRSIAGLLVRGACLGIAAATVLAGISRPLSFVIVLAAGAAQAAFLAFEWMELKRGGSSAMWTSGAIILLLLGLVATLVVEADSILTLTVR